MLGRLKLPSDPRKLRHMPASQHKNFPTSQGMYWMMKGRDILYIGITQDDGGFRDRWSDWGGHKQLEAGLKVGADVYFWPVNTSQQRLNQLETEAIRRWWPPLNKAKKAKKYKPKGQPHRLPRRLPEWAYVWLAISIIGLILATG